MAMVREPVCQTFHYAIEAVWGVIVIKNLDRNGEVVGAVLADDNSDYMLITNQGQLITIINV